MLPNELLQRLETAYAGKASPDELKALEEELNRTPEDAAEAEHYRRLWDGFAAWRIQQFRTETAQWEAALSELDDEELAEWYINGTLNPYQQQQISQRQKKDLAFAKIVSEQQQLQLGFSALKEENFREQLKDWEQAQPQEAKVKTISSRWFRPVAIAASFLLLLAFGGSWYSQNNYSNTALATKYYKVAPTGNTLGAGDERRAFLHSFDQAHLNLKADQHAAAVRIFEQLSTTAPPVDFSEEDLKYFQDNIDWNLIVARLGAGSTTGDFELRLNRITQDPGHTYYKQAVALQKDLESFWHW